MVFGLVLVLDFFFLLLLYFCLFAWLLGWFLETDTKTEKKRARIIVDTSADNTAPVSAQLWWSVSPLVGLPDLPWPLKMKKKKHFFQDSGFSSALLLALKPILFTSWSSHNHPWLPDLTQIINNSYPVLCHTCSSSQSNWSFSVTYNYLCREGFCFVNCGYPNWPRHWLFNWLCAPRE